MKMIILILKDNDSDAVTQALTSAQYRVTRVASTGGFLRSGVVTLLLGVRDERVDPARGRVEEDRAVETVPLPVHQNADGSAQHAAVGNPGRVRLHPGPQSVRVAPDLLHDVRRTPR